MSDKPAGDGLEAYSPLDHLPALGLGHVFTWWRALELQADRIADPEASRLDQQTDGYLFVIALRQLLRAAHLVRDGLDDQAQTAAVDSAIADFNTAVPDAKNARDVLDHFDAYAAGIGDLSHPGVRRTKRVPTLEAATQFDDFYEYRGDDHWILHIGPFAIDVRQARAAAGALQDALAEVIYEPVDPQVAMDGFGQLTAANPAAVALAFYLAVHAEHLTDADRAQLRLRVTPESLEAWGDFEDARVAIQGYSIASEPIVISSRSVAIKLVPAPVNSAQVRHAAPVKGTLFILVQKRPDLRDEWFVHAVADSVPTA